MPPKKGGTPTVAYVAKCSKCTKKHGPPLHEACRALLNTDPENQSEGVNPDDRDSDDNHVDDQLGYENLLGTASGGPSGQAGNHAVTQVITQDTASGSPSGQAGNNAVFPGTTSGGPGGQASSNVVSQRDDVLAAQLASMASAISVLASRYEATRSELGQLRVEVAATRTLPRAPAVSQQAASASVSDPTFIPSVASLRGDPVLAAQADQLVADLGTHTSGNGPSLNNVKRGLVRSGGDLAPLVKTPWPQDHIVGSG
jgi:hypothetical protein